MALELRGADRGETIAAIGQSDTVKPASGALWVGSSIDCSDTVGEYISGADWRIKANANVGYSHAGLISNVAGKVIANFWLDEIYAPEEGLAHRQGDIHIHDLDCLTGYCAGWSLRALLNDGFNGVAGRVSSRPPRHFREALGQMSNFLGILQSEWAGAQAFSKIGRASCRERV